MEWIFAWLSTTFIVYVSSRVIPSRMDHSSQLTFIRSLYFIALLSPLAMRWVEIPIGTYDFPGYLKTEVLPPVFHLTNKTIGSTGHIQLSNQSIEVYPVALIALLAISFVHFLTRRFQLRRTIHSAFCTKDMRRVAIYHGEFASPFVCWQRFRTIVVMPYWMIGKDIYALSLKHELQHIRQRDHIWMNLQSFLDHLFFWNPFHWLIRRRIGQLQELACDEQLVGRKQVSPQVYGRCLLSVLERAHVFASPPGAIGMADSSLGVGLQFHERRIHMLRQHRVTGTRKSTWIAFAFISAGLLSTAYAATSTRSPLSLAELRSKVALSNTSHSIPTVLNQVVLDQINLYRTDTLRNSWIRKSLRRMKEHRSLIQWYIEKYKHPQRLLAVPLIESGYRNVKRGYDERHSLRGAGLWMFIVSTARNYGMRVTPSLDERNNIPQETDAAMRYLRDNYQRFGNWFLALAAYNQGENHVQRVINETGIQDPWTLIEDGYLNSYAVEFMAAALIMENPDLVE